MANVRKTITASLGSLNDKDLFEFLDQMESKGVTVSKLVKDALRYYQANYISNKKKQKNDIDYNRIESIVEKTVKKALEEAHIASSLSLKTSDEIGFTHTVKPVMEDVKEEAKLPKGKQIKSAKKILGLEEQNSAEIKIEESPLMTTDSIEETQIQEVAAQIEEEAGPIESKLHEEISIEESMELVAAEETTEEIRKEEITGQTQEEEKEEIVGEQEEIVQEQEEIAEEEKKEKVEEATEEPVAEKKESDNSDLEALVSGMIMIR